MGAENLVRFVYLPHGEGLAPPAYESEGAAGMDIRSAIDIDIEPAARALVPTGFALEIPQGLEAQIRPRSGLAAKFGITVLNAPGTIDSDYRGEVKVILINHGNEAFHIQRGMRIAQLVFQKTEKIRLAKAEKLTSSKRGAGGFGSTGTDKRQGEEHKHAAGNP